MLFVSVYLFVNWLVWFGLVCLCFWYVACAWCSGIAGMVLWFYDVTMLLLVVLSLFAYVVWVFWLLVVLVLRLVFARLLICWLRFDFGLFWFGLRGFGFWILGWFVVCCLL